MGVILRVFPHLSGAGCGTNDSVWVRECAGCGTGAGCVSVRACGRGTNDSVRVWGQ